MPSQFTYKATSFSSQNWSKNTPVFQSDSSGKEKDSETGYYYFGARYYNSDLSLWLSVDPMSDKYPNLSPYNYCAWNPIKIVDPNGDSVYIKGEAAEQAANQLSSMGLTVTLDKKTGSLSYTKTGKDLTDSDKQLISAIKSKKIIVIVNATNEKTFCFESEAISNSKLCGQFLGVTLSDCKSRKAKTLQLVNPNTCEKRDAECEVLIGTSMRHEVTESFQAGKICLKKGISCGPCWDTWHGMEINGLDDHVYWEAHGKATPQAETFKRRKEMAKEQIRAELYKAIR